VASLIKRGGLSAHYQLHIILLMLPTINYNVHLNLSKLITGTLLAFSPLHFRWCH